ncbi:MAG TPA: hypothetical protein VIV11_28355 [Kofleriaceae bacterium]
MRDEWQVRIPKANKPKFPDVCIGCCAPATTSFRIASEAVGWWSVLPGMFLYAIATGRALRVPACDACIRPLRRQRRLRSLIVWAIVIIGVAIGFWIFDDWTGLARRFAVLGVAMLVALPYIAFEIFFPPAVDIVVTDNAVTFTFTNQDYADRFASENAILP